MVCQSTPSCRRAPAVVPDHYSRRIPGITVFTKQPSSLQVRRSWAGHRQGWCCGKHLVSDHGGQFDCGDFSRRCSITGAFRAALRRDQRLAVAGRLPPRETSAGLAEAVKVALIRDADFFQWLERTPRPRAVQPSGHGIPDSARRRAAPAAHRARRRPVRAGSARPLDFGHWARTSSKVLSGTRCGTARRWPSGWRWTRATRC